MATVLQEDVGPKVAASRVHGPQRVLKELRRLLIKTRRAQIARAVTPVEITYLGRVFDTLDGLVREGDDVLPLVEDPRDRRRVRKRRQ